MEWELEGDHILLSERCADKALIIAEVAERVGWPRPWDATMTFVTTYQRSSGIKSRNETDLVIDVGLQQ